MGEYGSHSDEVAAAVSKDWTCQGWAHTDESLRLALGHPPQELPQPPEDDICCAAVVYLATCQAAAPTVMTAATPHTASPTKPIVAEPNSPASPPIAKMAAAAAWAGASIRCGLPCGARRNASADSAASSPARAMVTMAAINTRLV